MARVLKRCRSTIFRELKRNHFSDESMPKHGRYYGAVAQLMAADRRARDLDIRLMTEQDMKEICDRLNNTPGKCLGWKTPTEVFREKMVEEMR